MLVRDGWIKVLALDVDGVLTDGRVVLSAGGESKALCFHDVDAVTRAQKAGVRLALITGERGELVHAVARRLGVSTVFEGAKDKLAALRELAEQFSVPLACVAFVGDADRDALAFPHVGMALAPANATWAARRSAHQVLRARGGDGAVAEVVDLLLVERNDERLAFEAALRWSFEKSLEAHQALLASKLGELTKISGAFVDALRSKKKVLLCGNGGSAADAQHVAAELVGRFAVNRQPWPAIALTTDTSVLTAVGNDFGFEEVFSRQVRALTNPGDVVVGISTSGGSENVRRALAAADELGAVTVAFTGARGGEVLAAAELGFAAPSNCTARIQELHLTAWHGVCELVEATLAKAVVAPSVRAFESEPPTAWVAPFERSVEAASEVN